MPHHASSLALNCTVLVIFFGVAACGGDDDAGSSSTTSPTESGGSPGVGGAAGSGGAHGAGGFPGSGGEPATTVGGSGSGGAQSASGGAEGSPGSGGGTASGGATAGGSGGADGSGGASGEPEFHVYLAVGQSNMQGAAHLPDETISHPRVLVLQGQNCSEHDIPYGEWREHFQPMIRCREGNRAKPDGSSGPIGLSPADMFAVTMAEAAGPNVTIGIVGAAYGGTRIEAQLPDCGSSCTPPFGSVSGAPVRNGTTPMYDWIVDLATKAQEMGEIKGIIFHQGESNSGQQSWLNHVATYVDSLRADLNLDPNEVPFIAGELPRTGCCAGHNALVQQIPDFVENGHWVSSGPMMDGTILGDRGDSLHWSTFSVIEMGKRYAEKMLEVSQ